MLIIIMVIITTTTNNNDNNTNNNNNNNNNNKYNNNAPWSLRTAIWGPLRTAPPPGACHYRYRYWYCCVYCIRIII